MKKLMLIFAILLFQNIKAEEMPCSAPPQVSMVEKANVLITLDMTGSMLWRAARDIDPDGSGTSYTTGEYSPDFTYYGYFHPDSIYQYSALQWVAVGYDTSHTYFNVADPTSPSISGNILNWAIMSRIDVARRVLTGGAGVPTVLIDKNTLIAEGSNYYSWYQAGVTGWPTPSISIGGINYRFNKPISRVYPGTNDEIIIEVESGRRWAEVGTYHAWVDVSKVPVEYKAGVIRQIADKDLDGNWDQGKEIPRFGLFFFSTRIWDLPIEFYETEEDPDMEPFLNAINNTDPEGGTPVGNAVLEAIHYISYVPPHWNLYTFFGRGSMQDPMYSGQGASLVLIPCRKNFVILIGDGESNSDDPNITSDNHFDHDPPFSRSLCDYDDDGNSWDCNTTQSSGDYDHPADDYAYYGHITDVRPDIPDYFNNIEFYTVFSFGTGSTLFMEIAKDGGFEDKNGDLIPQPDEYDGDGDGIPDRYYEATTGQELEDAIKKIIYEIMARVTSGTAVSIITQTSKAEGIAAFASYYPKRFFGTIDIDWIGTLKALWVDKFGFIREDNDYNLRLNLLNDYVISFYFDTTVNQTYIIRYRDVLGNGDSLVEIERVPVEDLAPVWDGSEVLLSTSPSGRNIWTFVDANLNGRVDAGEYIEFNTLNKDLILPHLDLSRTTFADTLIRYIRGEDFENLRKRTTPDGNVWKLGDIIFSTPLVVGEPAERYDLIYGDETYKTFYDAYKDRRVAVYVGANDGMLHVFNSGKLIETGVDVEPLRIDPAGISLGGEIYAYVPFNLLPHLKWLPLTEYCHVYYVDLKPYPTDVQIFPNDIKHPEGWGTVIIGGMRLGGLPCSTLTNVYSSAFFTLDVTDPDNITLLWERRLPDSSFTTSFPATVKVDTAWYLIIGSGPTKLSDVNSYQYAHIYVLDYKTGEIIRTFTLPDANSFIGDIISVDFDIDFSVDAVYFGTTILEDPVTLTYGGKLYKIKTNNSPDPINWRLIPIFDAGEPIVGAPSVAMDATGKIWVYFGTGRFFIRDDADYLETQYLVGVKDEDVMYSYIDLMDVTNVQVFNFDSVVVGGSVLTFRELQNLITTSYKGWYRILENTGERCITSSAVIGGSVLFTTYTPEFAPCKAGGEGRLYALYYLTGTAYYEPILGELPSGENIPSISTGPGLPAEPTVYVSAEGEKVFVQTGTGGIVEIETALPFSPYQSKIIFWKGR